MIDMAAMNASAKDDDPNFLYVKRRTGDGKYHNLAKLDPREYGGGETLHAAALPLCRSALAENQTGDAVVVSLEKPLGELQISWFYNGELTISMLRTICDSAYEPEIDMEEEDDEDEVGNNGEAW